MDIVLNIAAIIGFIALTAGTGMFVAFEFALTGLERSAIDNDARKRGDSTGKALQQAHNNLSFHLSGAQLGITITTLVTGFLAEPVLAGYFTPLLEWLNLPDAATRPVSLILALIIATGLSMIYGELVPKNVAITEPMAVARKVTRPVTIFNWIFKWLINIMNVLANKLVRKFGIEPADELASARSPQELGALVRNSAQHGSLDEGKAQILDRSLRFGETSAEDLMTPRSTIDWLHTDATVTDLLELALTTGHSRFPVADGDLDATVGVVHVKEAFTVPGPKRGTTSVGELAREVPVLPQSLDGDAVLNAVRSAGSQVVLIADEYGGTAGIVSIEDVVEEILGEVYDEHDDAEAEQEVKRVLEGWDCSGLVRIDELPECVGYFAPEGDYETLGGLLMNALGRIPAEGDAVLLPQTDRDGMDEFESGIPGRWTARITAMDGRRVDRALLIPMTDERAKEIFG
ncbi:hemolysin family protein [Corynebacterium sp. TAE3-ERU12]|uniref:hemolysin family protein n=1 Tax=Corynebacterium sp. TAE3-ERU12 TaxID=2849491 RepID=UPI001C451BDF|nr:hemolysin family protein [Corynebacterium sp. TAE3-ERU12]MBV7295505.1 hemolysin family protein [Corynebacterium sp. TAE3-ERU12]